MSIPSQRLLFDVPRDVAYFNCAYSSPQLNAARERLLANAVKKSHPWTRTAADFFTDAESLRQVAASALGGEPDGYAIIPSASYGVSTAARAVQPTLSAGDRIVVLDEEFPSNYYPWQRVAAESRAVIDVVTGSADTDWTQALLARIDKGVRVVAAPNCHWTNGAYVDLVAIGHACRQVGAALVVDATQSFGAMPLSLAEVQPAFLVAAGYKWLLFPYGVGLMYVDERWRDSRPLEENWQKRQDAENFAGLTKYVDAYAPGARRFDVGETCTATLPGAIAALEQIGAWTVADIALTLSEINRQVGAFLESMDFTLPRAERRCPHMMGATLPASYRGDFVSALRARNVFVSQRGNSVRFAPHLFIDAADLTRLFEAVAAVVRPR